MAQNKHCCYFVYLFKKIFFNVYFGEKAGAQAGEGEGEGDIESEAGSRPLAFITEPVRAELKSMSCEITHGLS